MDEIELIDILLKRYGRYQFDMDLAEFLDLCLKAIKQELKQELKQEWLSLYPFMIKQEITYMTFEEYFNTRTGANIDRRSDEEIIRDILGEEVDINGG